MTSLDDLVSDTDHVQLERLHLELSWRIDRGIGDTITELFTADGEINTLGDPIVGHDALRAWGAALAGDDSPIRGVRHVHTNMRFTTDGPDTATGTAYVTAYLPDAPEGRDTLPFTMGHVTDRYQRTANGWRFQSRVFVPYFMRTAAN